MATTIRRAQLDALIARNREGLASFYTHFTDDAEADRAHCATLVSVVDAFAGATDDAEAAAVVAYFTAWGRRAEEPIQFALDAYLDGTQLRRDRVPQVGAVAENIAEHRAAIEAARDHFMMH